MVGLLKRDDFFDEYQRKRNGAFFVF